MSYSEHLQEFNGQPTADFDDRKSWKGPQVAYRLREEYDDEISISDRLNELLKQPGAEQLSSLIIGAWTGSCEGDGASGIVEEVVQLAPKLPGLRALFLGELTFEECEISWINQTDVSPLLEAFPRLEVLRVRGGNGLSFSKIKHASLRELAVETGGLPKSVIREIFQCDFPALERLELLLGEENYGFNGSVQDLQPLLAGKLFPKLKYLGLMNSTIANDIAAVVVNSPIVDRIEVLDLSLGNLSEEGVQSLHGLAKKKLKRLDISHFFAPDKAIAALKKALPFEVVADDPQQGEEDGDDEWRPIVHAE